MGLQGSETTSRVRLLFFDANGRQTGRFVFPENPVPNANAEQSILIATEAFAALPGAPIPDVIIPPEIKAIGGKICFRSDRPPHPFSINHCISYGGLAFTGDTEGVGPAVSDELPIINTASIQRFQNNNFFGGLNDNRDFQLDSNPSPTNSVGETFTMTDLSTEEQGGKLYFE